jgi:nitrite reductase/ring-hydroxylating ferredoxin subunit/uncharacterized membrane protein
MFRKLIKDIEHLDAVDPISGRAAGWVQKATCDDAVENALSGTWLGHKLHPMLTDLPIGAWAMASVLDLTAGRSGADAARRLVGVGLIATVPTAATGAADWSVSYGAAQRVGLVHALTNLAGTVLQTASWVARRRGRRATGIALSGIGLGLTACAGYLGGHLTLVQGIGVNHTAFEAEVTDWTDVAAVSDLRDDIPVRVTPGGVPVVLVQHGGSVYALSADCVHAGGPLDQGTVVADACIRCPWHGSVFRLADGRAIRGPASVDEPSWQVKVDDGRVLVRSSAPAAGA